MSEAKPKLAPCPFCGKTHTLIVGAASDMWDEDQNGPFPHTETYAVFCDASTDGRKGGCGGSGGHFLTKEEAAEAWNRRSGQLVERVKELEEELQAVKHNQSASVAPIAYVDGDDAMRRILWEPTQAAFDIPVGTKLYTQPTPADAEDAARYRWLRRWKGQEHEPPFTVQHEIDGTLWGGDLDAAIDAALSKARPNTAEGE